MPNMFGGPQDHPDYTGIQPRARSKNESVSNGVLYVLSGDHVEVTNLNGSVTRYKLTDEDLPPRVRSRLTKQHERIARRQR